MADNIQVTEGSGKLVAADDVGGVLYQRVKIALGADGSAADLAPGQKTKANSLPVALASDDIVVDLLGRVNETAPINDTAAAGLNGRLQRIAQRISSLLTLSGAVDEAAPATDTASSGLNGRLQRIAQRLSSLIGLLPVALGQGTMAQSMRVVLPSDQSKLAVDQVTGAYDVPVTINRPANMTAYTATDAVGGVLAFPAAGPNGGSVMITGVQLEIDIAALPVGMSSFRLHLYSVTPPSAYADNAAWDLPSGDRASYLGYIDIGTPLDLGSTLYVETANVNKQVKLAGTALYGYLVTSGGYTPAANSEVYKVTLHTVAV